jgi:hypothetical protein
MIHVQIYFVVDKSLFTLHKESNISTTSGTASHCQSHPYFMDALSIHIGSIVALQDRAALHAHTAIAIAYFVS